jgi:hypothetical protein
VALVALALLFIQFADPVLRRLTRVTIEAGLGRVLQGEIAVDRVVSLSPGSALLEGVYVTDPQGRLVLSIKQLAVDFDLLALFRSEAHLTRMHAVGARARLIPSQEMSVSLFEAFLPQESGSPPAEGDSSFGIRFDDISLERADLYGDVPGFAGLRVSGLKAAAHIRAGEAFSAEVTRLNAQIIEPFSEPFILERGRLRITTAPALMLNGAFRIARGSDRAGVQLTYGATAVGAEDRLDLRVALSPVSAAMLRDLGIAAPETLISELRGDVHLSGPIRALDFRAQLVTDAGSIQVRGAYRAQERTFVQLTTQRLFLDKLLAYVPPVVLQGTFKVNAPAGAPIALSAQSPVIEVYGLTLSGVRFAGSYDNDVVSLGETIFAYAGGHFKVSGFVRADGDLKLRVRSYLPDTSRDPFMRAEGFRGRLQTDLTVGYENDELSANGRVTLNDASYAGLSAASLDLEGSASGDLDGPRISVRGTGSQVALGGVPLGELELSARGEGKTYIAQLAIVDETGRAAQARVRFERRDPSLRIFADSFTLGVPGRPAWGARADVLLQPDGVRIDQLELKNGEQLLDMKGYFSYSREYRVDAKLVRFDLGGLRELARLDLADLDGTVDGDIALTGAPGQPRIDARGRITNGQFLGMTGLALDLGMTFADEKFDVEGELTLPDTSRMSLVASGQAGQGREWLDELAAGEYEFSLDFQRVPFEVSRPWLSWVGIEPPAGTLSAFLRGRGTLNAPTIELTSRVEGLSWGDIPPLDIDLDLQHDTHDLTLRSLHIADEHGRLVRAEGKIEASFQELLAPESLRSELATRPFEITATWADRILSELPEPLRTDLPVSTSGKLDVQQSANGPAVALTTTLEWLTEASLGTCAHAQKPMALVSATAVGDSVEVKIDTELGTSQPLVARLKTTLDVAGLIAGTARWTLPPTDLLVHYESESSEETPFLCELFAGPLTMELSAKDILSRRPELSFAMRSPALQLVPNPQQRQKLGKAGQQLMLGRPLKVDMSGGVEGDRIAFIAHADGQQLGSLDVFGFVPRALLRKKTDGDEPLPPVEVKLQATNFELATVLVALPVTIRGAGRVDGDVRIALDVETNEAAFEGALALREGRLAVPALGQELTGASAQLVLQDDTIQIRDLIARDYEGKLSADGAVRFDTLNHLFVDLDFSLGDFPVRREGAQVSKLTGKLNLRAEVEAERMRAEARIADMRIDLPNEIGQGLQPLDDHTDIVVVGQVRETTNDEPYLYEVRIIAQNPPFRISRTDLNAEVRTDLTVRYREPILTIAGSASLQRGAFDLYGKRFELEQSQISFDGTSLDPVVNLYALYRISGDEIGVHLEGRLSEPNISFTHSDPTVTDTGEIIAQLLGGRSTDSGTTASSQDPSGAAASFLAGATAGLLTEEVRREFGGTIPVLAIESGQQAFRGTRIRAGVQLDRFIEKRLGPLRHVVRGAYIEGFVVPGAQSDAATTTTTPQSRGGGLLELRFPSDFLGTVEYRPVQNWRIDVAWEP